jgi:hypothetical protein
MVGGPAPAQSWEEYSYPTYAFAVTFLAKPQVEETTLCPFGSTVLDLLNGNLGPAKEAGIDDLPFKTETGKAKNGRDTTFIRQPLRDLNYDLFSKSDIEVFDEIIEKYGDASFEDLFNATHEHFAWINAWKTRKQGERAEMFYDEMIEDEKRRAELVEDISPVAAHMKTGKARCATANAGAGAECGGLFDQPEKIPEKCLT